MGSEFCKCFFVLLFAFLIGSTELIYSISLFSYRKKVEVNFKITLPSLLLNLFGIIGEFVYAIFHMPQVLNFFKAIKEKETIMKESGKTLTRKEINELRIYTWYHYVHGFIGYPVQYEKSFFDKKILEL